MYVDKNTATTYDLIGLTLEEAQAVLMALTAVHNRRRDYTADTVRRADRIHSALVNEVH